MFVFLSGLNKELDEIRGRILRRNSFLTIKEVFARYDGRKLGEVDAEKQQ